ncbi:MAG: hypothetical protein AAB473_03625 [Patescibacteria group bacterium]
MDYNDIKARLERLYLALNSRLDSNIESRIRVEHGVEGIYHTVSVSFDGGTDVADLGNKVGWIIGGIADLKDNLKNEVRRRGMSSGLIENKIKGSPHLQLIIDLANSQKHGYPLTKPERSGRSPKIVDIGTGLQGRTDKDNPSMSFSMDPFTGKFSSTGNVAIVISADIVDADDNYIMSLEDLIEGAMGQWQEIFELLKL